MMQKETNHPQKVHKKIFMIPHIKSGVLFINNQSLQAACPEKDLSSSVDACKGENIRSISPEGEVAQMTITHFPKTKFHQVFMSQLEGMNLQMMIIPQIILMKVVILLKTVFQREQHHHVNPVLRMTRTRSLLLHVSYVQEYL